MRTRIFHNLFTCLLLSALPFVSASARIAEGDTPDTPPFPDDPGELVYEPPTVIIMGDTIRTSEDSPEDMPEIIDVSPEKDSTMTYNTVENVITISSADYQDTTSKKPVIDYSGSDPLVIELCDSSSITADTVISSQADIVITGEGSLNIVGAVPIIGVPEANIRFESVTMHVSSVGTTEAVRRRVRGMKRLDEDGGPALSGFGSADFDMVEITPSGAEYGSVTTGSGETTNALYVTDEDDTVVILVEFDLTALDEESAVEIVRVKHPLDINAPMFNVLGVQVDASYRGIVVQGGQTYLLN